MKNYQNSNHFRLYEIPFQTTIKYFKKTENFYFLCITLFQLSTFHDFILPSYWSPTGPFSTMIPLVLCLWIEWVKDMYGWISNFFLDRSVNYTIRMVWDRSRDQMVRCYNHSLKRGDLIFLKKKEIVPVDMILIASSSNDFCKVNLSHLNGESYPVIVNQVDMDLSMVKYKEYKIMIKKDNKNSIGEIEGCIDTNRLSFSFSQQHVIVNGSVLLNDCYGIVVNCGNEKKLFHKNVKNVKNDKKKNSLSSTVNSFMMNTTIYILFAMVAVLSLDNIHNIHNSIIIMIQSWIVLNGIIPFSLNILLTFFRVVESFLLERNVECVKKTSPSLIDQFKEIDYVLSDKTGTITKNKLELIYVMDREDNIYNAYSMDSMHSMHKKKLSSDVIRGLGLCTNIDSSTPEDKSIYLYLHSKLEYRAQCVYLTLENDIEQYVLYPVELSFSVKRPISSQVFYDIKNDSYVIYTKASLSRLKNCLLEKDRTLLDHLDHTLTEMDSGLRLLGMGWRRLDVQEILDYEKRKIAPEQLENHLHLIGVMGIQDNLVDDVSETIQTICSSRGFGLLTGDRKITTISVAKKIGLISDDTKVIELEQRFEKYDETSKTLIVFGNDQISKLSPLFSIINYKHKMYPLLLGYGLTPEGKKEVTSILNQYYHTLAIGDGMNDIGMLEEANIGVSLSRNVYYYDFLCTEFKCLSQLFEYGAIFHDKNQDISLITMIKSCSISFCLFWMLYEKRLEWLFDLQTQQFFHLLWCTIHPFFYICSLDKNSLNHNKHNKLRWMIWILLTFIASTLLYHNSQTKESVIFNLIFQINLYLCFVEMSKQGLYIQLFNGCTFFFIYGLSHFSHVFVGSIYYLIVIGMHVVMCI